MNLVDLSAWRPYVVPQLPGVTEVEFRFALRRAAREFCRRAWVWHGPQEVMDLVAGQALYSPTLPVDGAGNPVGELARVLEAKGQDFMEPCTFEQAQYLDQTQAGEPPLFYAVVDSQQVRVVPQPTASVPMGLTLWCAFKPNGTTETLPEILLDEYAEGLAQGALWYLQAAEGRPYTDAKAADQHRAAFYGYIGQASVEVARGFARTLLETVPCW
jgi:hypothetical protein